MNRLEKSLVIEAIQLTKRLSELHANMVMITHFNLSHKESVDVSKLKETMQKLRKRFNEIKVELEEA